MIQALRILRDRNDVLALVAIALATFFFPNAAPAGIYGLGIVSGSTLALHAVGVVLVYRSNRIINFAQVQVGMVAATLFTVLTKFFPLVRLVRAACPPCLDRITPTVYDVNYYLSLGISLAFAVGLGYAVYTFVVKRFAGAPRLVLTVATIFLAQFLTLFQAWLPTILTTEEQRETLQLANPARVPFDFTVTWHPATFAAPDVLLVIFTGLAVGGLLVYFRRSATGVAIRAASENPSRVETLGVNTHAVTSRVWMFAALLSGVAAVLQSMTVGTVGSTSLSVSQTVRILAVALIARMVSLQFAAAGAVIFGILDQTVLWSFGSVVIVDGLLVVIVGAVLALQRYRVSRAELEQASAWRAAREVRPIPAELRDLPQVRRAIRWLVGIGVVVALGLPWAMSPSQNNLASVSLIYAMIALSLLVLTGWAGQISLGQFAFAAIGGYVAAVWGAPFVFSVAAGAVVGAITAVVVGLPALKMRGLHMAIMTMAFALATTAFLLNPRYLGAHLPDTIDRPVFLGMDFDDERIYYYFVLALLALLVAGVVGLRRSRMARALIAARDNEPAAQSFGINLVRLRLGAFAISGFVAALAGALFAYHQHGVGLQAYAPEQSVLMFTMTVIGGLGSVAAPLIGATYLGLLTIFGASPVVLALSVGGGGLFLLLFIPGGLGQLVYDIRDALLRRLATRHHIVVPSLLADVRVDQEERAPIAPNVRSGAGAVFVPDRYRLDDQWAIDEKIASRD